MRKSILIALAVVMVVALGAAAAVVGSEGQPAAKATAKVGDITVIGKETDMGWTTILSNTIKTANQKDLFIDVSLECGLYTYTQVKSKGGDKEESMAKAKIVVKVLVDGEKAYPGNVVFAKRMQKLTATFQGLLEEAMTVQDGNVVINEDELEPEEIELFLNTMEANSFNFIMDDLSAGEHKVKVKAKIVADWDFEQDKGDAEAWGTIGKGSVTIEEVRMIQDEDILLGS
jgi:hypothetical protein